MKSFKTIRESFGRLGIHPPKFAEKFDTQLNSRNVTAIIIMKVSLVVSIMYQVYVYETMMDYTAGVYAVATAIAFGTILDILVWKSSKIFKLLENFENFIDKRKFCHLIYFV